MKIKVMTILFSILALLILVSIVGEIINNQRFKKEVELLFSQSSSISTNEFSYDQLSGLPEPVQKYFKNALKEGQHYIS